MPEWLKFKIKIILKLNTGKHVNQLDLSIHKWWGCMTISYRTNYATTISHNICVSGHLSQMNGNLDIQKLIHGSL